MLGRHPGAVSQELDGEVLLLHPDRAEVLHLNGSGTSVWAALEVRATADEVVGLVAQAYGVSPEVVRSDVLRLLADLSARGLVRPVG